MIQLKNVKSPLFEKGLTPVLLNEDTMRQRRAKLLARMSKEGLDCLVIYADLEHGSNFEYLTGFLPRFEEALLILHKDGSAYMVLGNENLNKATHSLIPVTPIHMPHLSLPNQPMNAKMGVVEILRESRMDKANTIGLVGWKNFTSECEDNLTMFDLPYFLVEALKSLCPQSNFKNQTSMFIGEHGVRTINNANEFAHYEFGAAIGGNCMLVAMDALAIGVSEMQLASKLEIYGQRHSVVSIMATGKRFENANLYPTEKTIALGDPISMTTGFKGGLQSRSGYAVNTDEELPVSQRDYLQQVAIPYFQAVKTWLESIHIGMSGAELYDIIEKILPKKTYGWYLNPGHLCADEEWMSSPVYPRSVEKLKSGMLFQVDIIPSVRGYNGASCESGVFLADKNLQSEIKKEYPQMWERIQKRRAYMIEELGIVLPEEVLPTSNITAYYRPFLLKKDSALCAK